MYIGRTRRGEQRVRGLQSQADWRRAQRQLVDAIDACDGVVRGGPSEIRLVGLLVKLEGTTTLLSARNRIARSLKTND